jgi:tight adherence protein C
MTLSGDIWAFILLGITIGLFLLYWAAFAWFPALRLPFMALGMMVTLPIRILINWKRSGRQGAVRLSYVSDPLAVTLEGAPVPLGEVGDMYLYLRSAGVVLGALLALFTGAWILAGQAQVATEFGGITLGETLAASVPVPVQIGLYVVLFVLFTQLGWHMGALWFSDAVIRKRRAAINEAADFLDILAVCMEAGAEFDRAFEVAVIKWSDPVSVKPRKAGARGDEARRPMSWLKADLVQALIERNMGLARAEYFYNLARRALGPELEGLSGGSGRGREERIWAELVRTVERSRDLGTPLQAGFAALAERIRMERFARAEESAQRASAATWLPQIFLVVSMVITILTGVALSLIGLFSTGRP